MRRLLAFVMCISGFTLAVSWSRGDEPAAAATDAQLREATGDQPSARPEAVRIEPGIKSKGEPLGAEKQSGARVATESGNIDGANRRERLDNARLKNWLRLYDHQSAHGTSGPLVETLIAQLGQLEERMERLPDGLEAGFKGGALEAARQAIQQQQAETQREIALIERFLEEVEKRKSAAAEDATDKPEPAAVEGEVAPDDARKQAHEHERNRRERMEREQQSRPQAAAGDPIVQRLERELDRLRGLAAQVQDSAEKEAAGVRQEVERQIDAVEQFLTERRQQRDAAGAARDSAPAPASIAGAADGPADVARLRHLRVAIEHLEAAGMGEIAGSLRPHAENLQREIERQVAETGRRETDQEGRRAAMRARVAEMERARAERKAREVELNTVPAEVRELAEQVRELHRELRELRQEVGAIRQAGGERSDE